MKAPNKIYLQRNTTTDLYDEFWPEWFEGTHHPERDICYIRKDALLEWAKELKERWEEPPMSKHSPGCVYMLEQLIDKLNSM